MARSPPEAAAIRGGRTTRGRERTVGVIEVYVVARPFVNELYWCTWLGALQRRTRGTGAGSPSEQQAPVSQGSQQHQRECGEQRVVQAREQTPKALVPHDDGKRREGDAGDDHECLWHL